MNKNIPITQYLARGSLPESSGCGENLKVKKAGLAFCQVGLYASTDYVRSIRDGTDAATEEA